MARRCHGQHTKSRYWTTRTSNHPASWWPWDSGQEHLCANQINSISQSYGHLPPFRTNKRSSPPSDHGPFLLGFPPVLLYPLKFPPSLSHRSRLTASQRVPYSAFTRRPLFPPVHLPACRGSQTVLAKPPSMTLWALPPPTPPAAVAETQKCPWPSENHRRKPVLSKLGSPRL